MKKRKVQVVIFYCAKNNIKHFLLLKVNQKRGLFWQNVTGAVDEDEKYKHAALREAQEETSIKKINILSMIKTDLKFKFKSRWGKDVKEKVFIIQCKGPWEIEVDPSEHCDYKWVSQNDLYEDIVHYETNYIALQKAMELEC